jgi:hypothetical protein
MWCLNIRFPHHNTVCIPPIPTRATCPANLK